MRVFPIKTLLPEPGKAQEIASLGSGKLSSEVLQSKATALENSYLRVVKPQFIDPTLISETQAFYDKSRFYLNQLIRNKCLISHEPAIFYYQQIHHTGIELGGWILGIDADEYIQGNIKKHENTLTAKENRLLKHIAALESMAEPVLLTQKLGKELNEMAHSILTQKPLLEISDEFFNKHFVWKMDDSQNIENIVKQFSQIDSLYIADGHHRCASSSRYLIERYGIQSGKGIMSLVIDEDNLLVKPFYRMLSKIDSKLLWNFLDKYNIHHWEVAHSITYEDLKKGQILCITGDKKCIIEISKELFGSSALSKLDVTVLETKILQPLFDVQNSAIDERISFLRGDTPMDHIKHLLKSNAIEIAFLFAPNNMMEIKSVADEGSIMPPKSTFIEPKIPTGLIIEDYQ